MKITFNPSFKSKSSNIRYADDIQRQAKRIFPFLSPSYCDAFYKTSSKRDEETKAKYEKVVKNADNKLTAIRELAKENAFEGMSFDEKNLNAPIFQTLRGVQLLKAANCHECAGITIAALAANEIYDVNRVNINAQIRYINKETGKTEYKEVEPIDHTTVIAKIEDEDVIVDSWLGFADSISGAKGKFKQLLWDSDIREKARKHRSLFRVEKYEKTGKIINPDEDYEQKISIILEPAEKSTQEDMRLIGYYSRCCFPELITKPQKTDANI